MTFKECYAILGLAPGATLAEVKKAYRTLAFSLHPDLNPHISGAARQFQTLNEAYVKLTHASADRARARREAGENRDTRTREEAGRAYDKARKAGQGDGKTSENPRPARQSAYRERSKDEVLKDILDDPFARRVFEDIYSHVRKEDPKKGVPKAQSKNGTVAGASWNLLNRFAGFGKFKGWLKRQVDDEQILRLPQEALVPGAKVRLEIQHSFINDPQVVEITLPPEFVPGKSMRLKGMGRRIGAIRGDLIVRIEPA